MRKILSLILVVMFALAITARPSFALLSPSSDDRVKTYVCAGSTLLHDLNSTITSNNRLLGYKIAGTAAGTVGIYDATEANAKAGTGLADEGGIDASGANDQVWYSAPRNITTGLYVIRSASTIVITLYYE